MKEIGKILISNGQPWIEFPNLGTTFVTLDLLRQLTYSMGEKIQSSEAMAAMLEEEGFKFRKKTKETKTKPLDQLKKNLREVKKIIRGYEKKT